MSGLLLYIIVGLFLFGLLIAVHELGHFATAKFFGVRVNEFSIGMGPLLFSKQKGETLYSLRLIPMGGFCAMEGEELDTESPNAFAKKEPWKKLIILAAGSLMNFLAGFVILLCLFAPAKEFAVPVLASFMDGFPLESAEQLLPGDRILEINGKKIHVVNDAHLYLNIAKEDTIDFVIERNGEVLQRPDLPLAPREYLVDGELQLRYGFYFASEQMNLGTVLKHSWDTSWYYARSVWIGFQMLFQGDAGMKDLSGPVGIISMIGETGTDSKNLSEGMKNVCSIIALIAVNLAIVNLLPIPAMDGGRIFLLLLNQVVYLITKRNISQKYESYVHGIGFILLILLMVVVTFQDLVKLVT